MSRGKIFMRLIPEQVKYLLEKRDSLSHDAELFHDGFQYREKSGFDNIAVPVSFDYHANVQYGRVSDELAATNQMLSTAQYVFDRNFDSIDIGTGFVASFDDGFDPERLVLVEAFTPTDGKQLVSLESDIGRAVYGKKEGDTISYFVQATGQQLTIHIDSIDKNLNHYESFIRSRDYSSRMSHLVAKEYQELKENNPDEYIRRHQLSSSQMSMVEAELSKLEKLSNPMYASRISFLKKFIELGIAKHSKDGSIGVGSLVTIQFLDDEGNLVVRCFELINRAVSSELDSQYVERISPLGNALFGLHEGDSFSVPRQYKKNLRGTVVSISSVREQQKVRVLS